MIIVTQKGESYAKHIETSENDEEALLIKLVDMGVPTSIHELHRMTNMSITTCEKLAKRLRKAGMVEITPDSVYGKVAAGLVRGVGNIAKNSRRVDSAQLHKLTFGNPNEVPMHKRHPREEREVLRGSDHSIYRPRGKRS